MPFELYSSTDITRHNIFFRTTIYSHPKQSHFVVSFRNLCLAFQNTLFYLHITPESYTRRNRTEENVCISFLERVVVNCLVVASLLFMFPVCVISVHSVLFLAGFFARVLSLHTPRYVIGVRQGGWSFVSQFATVRIHGLPVNFKQSVVLSDSD